MEPVLSEKMENGSQYLYQVKWDGVRVLSCLQQGEAYLYTRRGNERTQTYPEIVQELINQFATQTMILDGEMIRIKDGKPDFFAVMKRDRLKNRDKIENAVSLEPVCYVVFDLLYFENRWMFDEPLERRLLHLQNVIQPSERLQFCFTTEDGEGLYRFTKERGWEGVVIKERTGKYYPGEKHPTWRKVKHFQELTAYVAGVTLKAGRVYSLLLSVPGEQGYRYIGKAATGLSQGEMMVLTEYSRQLDQKQPTVVNPPRFPNEELRWFVPSIQVVVQYLEWTPEGTLRSPVVKRFLL
jgi:bifunctional non-homologous end joining protein LigD